MELRILRYKTGKVLKDELGCFYDETKEVLQYRKKGINIDGPMVSIYEADWQDVPIVEEEDVISL